MNVKDMHTAVTAILAEQPVVVISGAFEDVDPAELEGVFKQWNQHPSIRFLPIVKDGPVPVSDTPGTLSFLCVKLEKVSNDFTGMISECVTEAFKENCEDYGVSIEEYRKLTGG